MIVNGIPVRPPDPGRRLLDFLREDLDLTAAKEGCSMGECGACTVLVDDDAVCSCLMLVGQVAHAEVTTLEGLANESGLSPVQRAFVELHASQCGYCTPGFIMAATALIRQRGSFIDDEAILASLEGNLCRCTGYVSIVSAVKEAARKS